MPEEKLLTRKQMVDESMVGHLMGVIDRQDVYVVGVHGYFRVGRVCGDEIEYSMEDLLKPYYHRIKGVIGKTL